MTRPPARLAMISSSWLWAKQAAHGSAAKSMKRIDRHQRGRDARCSAGIVKRRNIIYLRELRPPRILRLQAWHPKQRDRDTCRRESPRESYEYWQYLPADF